MIKPSLEVGSHIQVNPARFKDCTVLVLGDIMVDRYVGGRVQRISPEAPIPVLRFDTSRAVLGGAGNVANNIASLGAHAILVGIVGDDATGRELRATCANVSERITIHGVIAPGRCTTVKTRFMSGVHQLLRLDEEETTPLSQAEVAALLERYEQSIQQADVVILSDYAKGVLCDAVLERAIAVARHHGKPMIADPKRADFSAYRHVTVLTPNEHEVAQATGIQITDDVAAESAGERALAASEAEAVLVTRSEKGLTLVRRDATPLHLPTEAREVSDVSGAGDTLVAAFAVSLASGASLEHSARAANVAAGIAVSKLGTATVSGTELRMAMHRQEVIAIDDKVAVLANAQDEVNEWRAQGQQIGFTNGCFDLIHPGHVRLLQAARAQCDRLVVGLNTDASVQRLKGPTRPVQTEAARATVMASIGAVDLVVLFDEDTPMELIRALRPDRLFKGADYTIDQVVGGDVVHANGGQVVLIDLEAGHSTTGIIRRMNLPERSAS